MIRLLAAELRADWRSWVGLVLVAAVGALAVGIGASMLETGIHAGGDYLRGFSGGAAMVLMFSGVSAVAVVAAVARLAVELGRAGYARWQLAGVGPGQTAAIVLAQVVWMCVVGSLLGFGIVVLAAEPLIHAAFEGGTGGYREIPIVTGPLTALVSIGGMALVGMCGGLRAAFAAGRTPALAALRDPEPQGKRMRWRRWILFALVLVGVGWNYALMLFAVGAGYADDRTAVISQLPLIAPALTLVIVAGGPAVYPLVLRGWTAVVPARASVSWYLARHQARYHLGRSTASITPLFTGIAMLGGLYSMAETWGAAMRSAGERFEGLKAAQILLMLGGPVLLAACGAAVVVFMSNRTQGREQALLSASGASDGTVLGAAVRQAVIHVVTAALLAFVVIAATSAVSALLLAPYYPGIVPRLDLAGAGILLTIGFALTVAAVVIPVAIRSRYSIARVLSRE